MPKMDRTRETDRGEPYTAVQQSDSESESEPGTELEQRPSIEYMNIVLGKNFEQWLSKKADPIKHQNLMKTLTHFRENGLTATLQYDFGLHSNPDYEIYIKGPHDSDFGLGPAKLEPGISFRFYREEEAQWRFGIQIKNTIVTDKDGEMIDMEGLGYARLLMVILYYCVENVIDKPIDLKLAEKELIIGICADVSKGFWKHMGMEEGRYSAKKGRHDSVVGQAVGFDREFQMKDWERWLFSDREKANSNKHKRKKHKKKKKHTKRKKKRKSKKSKMR